MPVSDLIRKIRINKACRQLALTDTIISSAASSCGYNDMKSFYAAFKKVQASRLRKYRDKSRKKSRTRLFFS